ncbi:MAG: SUMF1/EgtB/PvdO family nonheme iron enzyme [Planctomycetes bacterium]|nr:SUMF1/EgtB/PvdO family nonheme iron enzyme [Planctomycetota bacterium]MCB9890494.1 SUMF1/EgtB/PvdO family nonheme iron enzyme [Planctomycetota bacterium]MCB9917735.1 SUMF1/EgtB/PvdO family nonheme iron enzyme [Planctomycetota bacterium]
MGVNRTELDRLTDRIASILELPDSQQDDAFRRLRDRHPEHREFLVRCEEAAKRLVPDCAGRPTPGRSSVVRDDVAPERIENYEILAVLGEGGMGTVYLAQQIAPIQRRVALKVIKLGMATKEVIARFEAERQALARMDHRGIAHVFDVGTTIDGQPYFAMEHVDGERITDYCAARALDVEGRLRLFQEVCNAVQHAHLKCVLHRDLKPSNILVKEEDGRPVPMIIDFGIAKATDQDLTQASLVTEAGRLLGTPAYMSPEQAEMTGRDVDARTDIYSLGVVLYELLTGVLPFDARQLRESGLTEIQRRIREDEPPKPSTRLLAPRHASSLSGRRNPVPPDFVRSLKGDLDWITMRCLEKEPSRRYQSASELASDVQRHLDHEPVLAGPPSTAYRLRKLLRKRRTSIATAAIILLMLVIGLVVTIQKERMAVAALDRYQQMKAVPLAEDLLQEADHDLWPANAQHVDAMDRWLVRARQLVQRASTLEAKLKDLETLDGHAVNDYEGRFLRGVFTHLLANVHRLMGDDGLLAQVEARRARAATLRDRSLEAPASAWHRALASITANPKYRDLRVFEPQLGLVPLGVDPASQLEEFAVLDTGVVPTRDGDGSLVISDTSTIVLVLLPPGTFFMGAQARDENGPNHDRRAFATEGPVTEIELDAFFLSKYEMTQGQWLSVMESNPSLFSPPMTLGGRLATMRNPVESVSWRQCSEATRRLGLLLPTEAQWEYAARAGTSTPWWTGRERLSLSGVANIGDRYSKENGGADRWEYELDFEDGHSRHAPVGSFAANPFGLHDLLGNVSEWCRDEHGPYTRAARRGDGLRENGFEEQRSIRGGSWRFGLTEARCSARVSNRLDHNYYTLGLRPSRAIMR